VGPTEGNRLPLDVCRRLLGPSCTLSDTELERLCDDLYRIAGLVVTLYEREVEVPPDRARLVLRSANQAKAAMVHFGAGPSRDAETRMARASAPSPPTRTKREPSPR